MKWVKMILTVSVVVALLLGLLAQQRTEVKLRAENATLAQQLAQLQADNESLSNQVGQAKASSSQSKEQLNELLKLRGEVGVLRRQTAEQSAAQRKMAAAPPPVVVAPLPAAELTPDEQFKLQEFHTVNAMKQLGLAMRIHAGDNNDQFATNFDQLKNELGGVTNFAGNISLDAFEFVNAGRVNDTMPDMIIFRERVARPSHNGSWQRIYGLADGSAQTIYSSGDGSFDEYEKPRLVSLPANQ